MIPEGVSKQLLSLIPLSFRGESSTFKTVTPIIEKRVFKSIRSSLLVRDLSDLKVRFTSIGEIMI